MECARAQVGDPFVAAQNSDKRKKDVHVKLHITELPDFARKGTFSTKSVETMCVIGQLST